MADAIVKVRKHEWERALDIYAEILEQSPQCVVWVKKGRVYERMKLIERALKCYKTAV